MEIKIIMYTDNTMSTRFYSVTEVSRLFGVGRDTVIRMIKDGRLDGSKHRGRYIITEDSMKRLVKGDNK